MLKRNDFSYILGLELCNIFKGNHCILTRCLRISTAIYPWLEVSRTSYIPLVRISTIRSIWYHMLFKNHRFLVSLNMLICSKTFASLITLTLYVPPSSFQEEIVFQSNELKFTLWVFYPPCLFKPPSSLERKHKVLGGKYIIHLVMGYFIKIQVLKSISSCPSLLPWYPCISMLPDSLAKIRLISKIILKIRIARWAILIAEIGNSGLLYLMHLHKYTDLLPELWYLRTKAIKVILSKNLFWPACWFWPISSGENCQST